MKYKYSVCVLGDKTRRKELNDRYSFIDELDDGKFGRVNQDEKPDFFVIDLDIPANNLNQIVAEGIENRFVCRPIIFVSIPENQHSRTSAKVTQIVTQIVPYVGCFCKTSTPCCESIDDLKEALRWFRFYFKDDDSAANLVIQTAKQIFEQFNPSMSRITE